MGVELVRLHEDTKTRRHEDEPRAVRGVFAAWCLYCGNRSKYAFLAGLTIFASLPILASVPLLVSVAVLATPAVVYAEAAKTMYLDAMAREQAVRASMSAGDASPALLDQVRSVVVAYEAVVKRFPTSGYSDNALWQAGRLSLDTFERFGQSRDRDTASRLLRRLARAYITSKLAKQVPEQLARIG